VAAPDPGVWRPRRQGHVAAPDPFPSGEWGPGALTSSKAQASWRSGFHMWGSRTSPRGFGTCSRESGPVEAGPEHFVQVDTWQRRTCHLVGSGPGGRCPQLSGPGFCVQLPRGLVRGYGEPRASLGLLLWERVPLSECTDNCCLIG